MIRRIVPILVACCVTACAGQQTGDTRPTTVLPDKCTKPGYEWKLDVVFNAEGAPIGVKPGEGNTQPIRDAANLRVKPCDTVAFKVRKGGHNRSAMISFDKDPAFRSPGKKPAYLTRKARIVVPIDLRVGSGDDPFAYSIHVDCPENTDCPPLDPMIIVER